MYNLLTVALLSLFPASSQPACSNIVHVGDSVTLHSMKYQYAEYEKIGYKNAVISAAGSRSIFTKTANDKFTGLEAVKYYKKRSDSKTCWVIALGTNDSGLLKYWKAKTAIVAIVDEIPNAKILWVNVWKGKTKKNGPTAIMWNNMLNYVAANRPNVTVLDWAKLASENKNWINPDGVHHNMLGSQARARIIAREVNNLWGN